MEAEARYHPDREQLAIANAFNAALTGILPIARLHGSTEEDAQTWAALDSLGVFGIAAGEELGGSNLGATEEALVVF
jgi:alkylation response protein AidB-like acyl-CoA dehydrogenase